MKSIEINGILRESTGKKDSKKLRKEENVPCVLYGKGENVHFYAHINEFRPVVYTPNIYTLKIKISDKSYDAILQDIQFHPVTDNITHIDFLQFDSEQPIKIAVPVKLTGFAKGVQEGGKLNLEQRKLNVRGLLKDIPDQLIVDVTSLTLGKVKKIGELSFENLELLDPANNVVASVKLTRAAKGMEAGEEGEEGEEGESGGEGDAPAAEENTESDN